MSYSFYLVAAEDASVGKALSRSFELAKKSWLLLLIMMIILSIIFWVLGLIQIINILVSAFAGVFAMIVLAEIYQRIK